MRLGSRSVAFFLIYATVTKRKASNAEFCLQGISPCRSASAMAWAVLRAPSLLCAFFRWLRTVSAPMSSALATSDACAPIDANRRTASSRGVSGIRGANPVGIEIDELVQPQCRKARGCEQQNSNGLRQDIRKFFARPEGDEPATANWAGQSIAHSVLESQLIGRIVNADRLHHSPGLIPAHEWIDSFCPGAIPWSRSS